MPETLDWVPGLVTVTVLVMFQVKVLLWRSAPRESVAVTVTEQAQAVVGVPLMTPLLELIDRPAGRPVAAKVTALPPVVSWGAADGQVGDGRARHVGLGARVGDREVVDVPGQASTEPGRPGGGAAAPARTGAVAEARRRRCR